MREKEFVDWNFFWRRVKKHPLFLEFLYRVHLRKYTKVLKQIPLSAPDVLELGAGTGQASLHIEKMYGGHVTLVDNNPIAYELHKKLCNQHDRISYIRKDFFNYHPGQYFDLVLSDGLLEHYSDKKEMVQFHQGFAKKGGYVLIFALNNNAFTKMLELGEKKMGYSEPIPMAECIRLCKECGMDVVGTVKYFFEYGLLCKNGREKEVR